MKTKRVRADAVNWGRPLRKPKAVTLTKVDRVLADYPSLLRGIADDIEHFAIAYGAREQKRRK